MIRTFYTWFYDSLKKDAGEVLKLNKEYLCADYMYLINDFDLNSEIKIAENYFNLLSDNNKDKINEILNLTKEEYYLIKEDIGIEDDKFIYYNNVLIWYEFMPVRIKWCFEKILENQNKGDR